MLLEVHTSHSNAIHDHVTSIKNIKAMSSPYRIALVPAPKNISDRAFVHTQNAYFGSIFVPER